MGTSGGVPRGRMCRLPGRGEGGVSPSGRRTRRGLRSLPDSSHSTILQPGGRQWADRLGSMEFLRSQVTVSLPGVVTPGADRTPRPLSLGPAKGILAPLFGCEREGSIWSEAGSVGFQILLPSLEPSAWGWALGASPGVAAGWPRGPGRPSAPTEDGEAVVEALEEPGCSRGLTEERSSSSSSCSLAEVFLQKYLLPFPQRAQ